MPSYKAPLREYRFLLKDVLELDRYSNLPSFSDAPLDLIDQVLEEGAKFCEEVLAPLNKVGDEHGCKRADDGAVTTPPGFKEAYAQLVEAGWPSLTSDPAYGGQGLPHLVGLAWSEMVASANMAFGMYPGLSHGAYEAIHQHGSDEQKQTYLPKLVTGEWTGTMNLTEPHCGTDLGLLRTKAIPQADGSYRITGQKIFISAGEHDLASNIIHLVLARIEGAPAGSKGISMFIVPKFRDEDGSRNAVRCIGLEEKMGIHASPTCTMAFEGAEGWLIGEENRGLAAMFTMMNAARLNVGMQGVAVAEAAYQKAHAYAQERKQGGALIIEHPDVRRMLTLMKAKIQAGRALCYATAIAADGGDKAREDLLTPLAKAWCTELGVEAASLGVQVHGGMGFVEEGGAAQFYRDARIAPIYEGTNGIQAMDLYGRKLLADRGEAMAALIAEAREAGKKAPRLKEAAAALEEATAFMLTAAREDALAGSFEYLMLAGDVAGGMLLARGLARANDEAQRALFHLYGEYVLARAGARLPAIKIGAGAYIA